MDQHWSATTGLHESGKAFLLRLPQLGFDAARKWGAIVVISAAATKALNDTKAITFPSVDIRVAMAAVMAAELWMEVNAFDCNFSDAELKTSCRNFQAFGRRLDMINDEIRRNYTHDELLQLGK